MLTIQEVHTALPPHAKGAATQELVDKLNAISADPEIATVIRENFVSHTIVLKEGRFKVEDYLNAVSFVSFKMMGYSNRESYVRTFPVRYQALAAKGTSDKDISAYVAGYNKNKLVNLILEQTLIPIWVLNQDIYQKAISSQVDLMLGAKSEMVRTQAANSLLLHLKPPEKKQIDLNIGMTETSGMAELKAMLGALANQQLAAIGSGVTTREIAHQKLIKSDGDTGNIPEMIDVTPTQIGNP